MNKDKLTKIVLRQEYENEEEAAVETPWAEDLGDNKYKIKNFPFFYYGVSYDDVVEAKPIYDDDMPYLTRVLEKSGHKTVRIILDEPFDTSQKSRDILDALSDMECGYEGNDGKTYFVINVQPQCDFDKVCGFLTEKKVKWEHADPTFEELYPDGLEEE